MRTFTATVSIQGPYRSLAFLAVEKSLVQLKAQRHILHGEADFLCYVTESAAYDNILNDFMRKVRLKLLNTVIKK